MTRRALGVDVGGVIVLSPWELLEQRVPHMRSALCDVMGPFGEGRDAAYQSMLDGRLSESAYWELFVEQVKARVPAFRDSMNPIRDLILEVADPFRASVVVWLRSFVARGSIVYTFSNGLHRNMGRGWFEGRYPPGIVTKHFDALDTGIRKPDRGAYGPLAAFRTGDKAARVAYVDDNPHYAAAAGQLAIAGFWFNPANETASIEAVSTYFTG